MRSYSPRSYSTRSYSVKSYSTRSNSTRSYAPRSYRSNSSSFIAQDTHGRIKRSASARNDFKRSHPCPSTGKSSGSCPGYIIDHVKALKRGGADSPLNMKQLA